MRFLHTEPPFAYALLILTTIAAPTMGWMLSQLGLNETYRVRHISMHYTRVFLCISVDSNAFPTLIESRWPKHYIPLGASIFPNMAAHDIGKKTRNCRQLQRAIWTQVDSLSRLWVMDIGWVTDANDTATQICYPKLLVYDLLRNNAEVLRIDCARYIKPNSSELLTIKLGPPPGTTRCRSIEKYVYFLHADDPHILAYDIIEQRWQYRTLISRKYEQMLTEMLPIKPIDMAFGPRHELLISDVDGELFSTGNALLRHDDKIPQNNIIAKSDSLADPLGNTRAEDLTGQLKLDHLGSLLGPSRGMMVDLMSVLYYVVPKFGAVVRCSHYRRNLTAEGNEIIYMTSKNIQQIFFGSEDSVWLVTDRELQPHDHCFAGLS